MKRQNFKLGFRNASAEKQLEIFGHTLTRLGSLPAAARQDVDLPGLQAVVDAAHTSRQRIRQLKAELKQEVAGHQTHLRAARVATTQACLKTAVNVKGEPAAMAATGLPLASSWQKAAVPAAPQNLRARATESAGEIRLDWKRPLRRCFFKVEFTTNPTNENGWQIVGGTRSQSLTVPGLKAGRVYYFRVRAENIHGQSPQSNLASAMAR